MFEGMFGAGRSLWVALSMSALTAGLATVWFLSAPAGTDADPSPPSESASSMGGSNPAEEAGGGTLDASTVAEGLADGESTESTADVTFSFAQEVHRFDDGTILEQDDLHRVTCRSAAGEERWAIGMEGPLMGAHRLDANGDGRDEFLLVDAEHLVGLDGSGRPIPGFSVRPGAAITSHAVVDYDGDGKERYLLGLADGRVLNHRKLGESTPGWRHESKGTAVQAIAHLRAGRKDYVCTVDARGVVMLLKRNGQRRVRTPAQLHAQEGPRAVAFEVKSDIGASLLLARNADGAIEARAFQDGVPRPASGGERQLLEAAEAKLGLD